VNDWDGTGCFRFLPAGVVLVVVMMSTEMKWEDLKRMRRRIEVEYGNIGMANNYFLFNLSSVLFRPPQFTDPRGRSLCSNPSILLPLISHPTKLSHVRIIRPMPLSITNSSNISAVRSCAQNIFKREISEKKNKIFKKY
jgi:hypothetical protein